MILINEEYRIIWILFTLCFIMNSVKVKKAE